jgi:AcrR family transcriptional regulator
MTEVPSPPVGLRERKKLATRVALSDAAFRLAVERGFNRVRVEEIAAEAGVSTRTFNNYFSCKEEAIVSLFFARVESARVSLAIRPQTEPLWEVIAGATIELLPPEEELGKWRERVKLIRRTPALEAEYLKATSALERVLVDEIAKRTGLDPETSLYPLLAACVAVAAIRAAMQHWLDGSMESSYPDLLRGALADVGTGLPVPERGNF